MFFLKKILIGLVLFIGITSFVLGDVTRVGIISNGDTANLSSLVMVELSGNKDVCLLERDDLAKAGDELKLQRLAGSDPVALGKLVGADVLLFLEKKSDTIHIRLTAVGLGYALLDDEIASSADLPLAAKSIAHRMEGYVPKLKLSPDHVIPISVLNLRADYPTTDSSLLERKLTLLLESRLASLSQYVVLERRHAWSLHFEHSISETPQPLLKGAYVIDGNFNLPTQDTGDLTLHLRLRSPNGQESNMPVQGSSRDLPGLVDKMMAAIKKCTGSADTTSPMSSETEAREYLMEGIWGWSHKASHEALEALDSAELLGEKAPELFAVRIKVLCDLASDGLDIENGIIVLKSSPLTIPPSQRADFIIRAICDTIEYEKLKADPHTPVSSADLRERMSWCVHAEFEAVPLASNILVQLDRDDSVQADRVRDALRPLTHYDPLHGILGSHFGQGGMRDLYTNEWPKTLEEQLATCRLMCTAPKQRVPFEFLEHDKGFCDRFIKTPEEQKAAFDHFVHSLKDIPSARLPYLLICASSSDPAQADKAYLAYLSEVWERRDEFAKADYNHAPWSACLRLPQEVRIRNAKASLPLLHYVLTHRNAEDDNGPIDLLWLPEGWTVDDASQIWREYQGFKQRGKEDLMKNKENRNNLDVELYNYEISFFHHFPQFTPSFSTLPSPTSLVVTRFWHPWKLQNLPRNYPIIETIMASDDDSVWLKGVFCGDNDIWHLFHVTLPNLGTQTIPIPVKDAPESICCSPSAIYATWQVQKNVISRFDRKTSKWTDHSLPEHLYAKIYSLKNSLYLFLELKNEVNDAIMARYDWDLDKMTILSSTRRRPAQNQFDDRSDLCQAIMLLGPGRKPCAITDDGTFYIQETQGAWAEVFDGSFFQRCYTNSGLTLLSDQRGELVLINPDADALEYWMASSEPIYRKRYIPGSNPVKEMAPWASQTIWDPMPNDALKREDIGFNKDHLFIIVKPKINGGIYDLLCYTKGKGRSPQHIPLEFHLSEKDRAILYVKPQYASDDWKTSDIEHPDTTFPGDIVVTSTKSGLCIQPYNVGFWFLPYSDIDAYLKTHGSVAAQK